MFRRRRQDTLERLRNFFWPRMGWGRVGSYFRHRIARLPGTPHMIALGFAAGVGTSFTPLVGFHIALAVLLIWPFRGSVVAAAIGTFVGNPWTFPFMWLSAYTVGCWIIGHDPRALSFHGMTLKLLWEHKLDLLIPWMIGSIPTGVAGALAFYFPIRSLIIVYRAKRLERRMRKAQMARPGQKGWE